MSLAGPGNGCGVGVADGDDTVVDALTAIITDPDAPPYPST